MFPSYSVMSLEHQPTERIKKQYLQMVPLKDFVWDVSILIL